MKIDQNIGLTDFFVIVYGFCKKNLLLLSIFTLTGLSIGGIYAFNKANYFYSELSGYSLIVPKPNLLEVLSPLEAFAEERNYEQIGKSLNVSTEDASAIRSLAFASSKHIKTSNNPKVNDDILGEVIIVKIETYNQKLLPQIENGLLYFLNNSAYMKNALMAHKRANTKMINEFYGELNQSDSLRKNLNSTSDKVTILNNKDPKHLVEALEIIEQINIDNSDLSTFTVVSSFYNLAKPANKTLLIATAAGILFFFLGLFVALYRELSVLYKGESVN